MVLTEGSTNTIPGRPEVSIMAAGTISDNRQLNVTVLAVQVRIGCQLIVVSLTWSRFVTGGTIAVLIARDAAVTTGTGNTSAS